MTDLQAIDAELERLTEIARETQMEKNKLVAQRKAELQRLEDEKLQPWIDTRKSIPEHVDRDQITQLLEIIYREMKWPAFRNVVFLNSLHGYKRDSGRYGPSLESVRLGALRNNMSIKHLQLDPFRPLYSAAILHCIPNDGSEKLRMALEALNALILDFLPRGSVPVVLQKPDSVSFNADNRFHNEHEPAVIWGNNQQKYYVNGVEVTERFIKKPPTLSYIDEQPNQERRRILLERYGEEKYLNDRGAKIVHQDEYGKLWKVERDSWRGLETVDQFVEVTNSTAEPNGTFRKFFLRVPPDMVRAKQAIAWTFNMEEHEYNPRSQS